MIRETNNSQKYSPMQVLHLALALELKPLRLTVVSADPQLLAASKAAGLHIINPEED